MHYEIEHFNMPQALRYIMCILVNFSAAPIIVKHTEIRRFVFRLIAST